MWALWLSLAPLWLPLAAVADLLRGKPMPSVRCGLLVLFYLSCEVLGILVCLSVWLYARAVRMDEERWQELHFTLEAWWGSLLFAGILRIYRLELKVSGDADLGRGPYVYFQRHTSIGEVLLAASLVSRRYGTRLRYVFKREHLWAPCLNLVGHRIPNVFVDRFSDDAAREIARIQTLGRGLGPRDGVLIYPEGTRFSEEKRTRVLERLRAKGDTAALARAQELRFVLPPRMGGPLGLLEVAPNADVVLCAHVGFEASATLARLWDGELVGAEVSVHFRRIPRGEIPEGRAEREAWLWSLWSWLDDWVAKNTRA